MRRTHAIGWELHIGETEPYGIDDEGEKVMNLNKHDDTLGLKLIAEVQLLRYALEQIKNREEARALKGRLVDLHHESTSFALAPSIALIVDTFFTESKARIVKLYGTAAWDEPETLEETLARMAANPLPQAPGPGVLDRVQPRTAIADSGQTFDQPGVVYGKVDSPAPPLTDEDLEAAQALLHRGALSQETATATGVTYVRLLREVRRLRGQLPAEMQNCTILLKWCEKGHARLTATNWIDHGCSKCEVDRLGEELAEAVAELNSLRSDEWLKKAAEEIAADRAGYASSSGPVTELRLLQALRRHRDGKA